MVHAHKIRIKGAHVQLVLTEDLRARLLELLQGATDCIVLDDVMMRSIRIHKLYSSGMKFEEAKSDHIKVDRIRLDLVPPYDAPF